MNRTLGVCYYPEHWPEDMWAKDAAQMVATGLSWVRIGEFAWARMEPQPGQFDWGWLDRAIDVLGKAGLKVILGTPTATPPRWMMDKYPDMVPIDADGRPRGFGSRRHYCFSHDGYCEESRRITRALAVRYGKHPSVAAWQTDNEYDCHDTAISYSSHARMAFQDWCAARYQSTDALNRAWGNVFWSMDYDRFDQIDLPNLTVTDPNPSHVLAFRRFSSDQVVRFNRVQCDEIRQHSTAPIIHNFMGRITTFDHYAVGADLDISSWDSYPMGFLLDRVGATNAEKERYLRQGDPDFQAFHHDLYRATSNGRWWIMEQQPGPVNWAPWNPAPLPGMPRLWAWEAFAHGAETVCYFRWRQAPFAQEQMHAGLLQPNSDPAPALADAAQVAGELAQMADVGTAASVVALVFDYDSAFAWETQPQGADFDYFQLVFDCYKALRRKGLNVDVVPKTVNASRYDLVFAPGLMQVPDGLTQAKHVIVGPRAGSKTQDMTIPDGGAPEIAGLAARVLYVESLPPFAPMPVTGGGAVVKWRDHLEGEGAIFDCAAGPVVLRQGAMTYLGGWPDSVFWARIINDVTALAGVVTLDLPADLRIRDTQTHRFYFNYGPDPVDFAGQTIDPAGVFWELLP
ncbi:MAG: beta-galactosidase [Pseudomonadota bacterium]